VSGYRKNELIIIEILILLAAKRYCGILTKENMVKTIKNICVASRTDEKESLI